MSNPAVAALLADGAWALAQSRRACDVSRRLHDEACGLLLTYRAHRFQSIRGASAGDTPEHHRDILRSFASHPAVKVFGGPSRGGTCALCGETIRPAQIEYDIEASESNITVDVNCYKLFIEDLAEIRATTNGEYGPAA